MPERIQSPRFAIEGLRSILSDPSELKNWVSELKRTPELILDFRRCGRGCIRIRPRETLLASADESDGGGSTCE